MTNYENMFEREGTGASYLASRPSYPAPLYDIIISKLDETSSVRHDTVVDLGCGPGQVARSIAPYFKQVLAFDPSKSQIQAAEDNTKAPNIKFGVCSADDLSECGVGDNSVDLLVAGTAAHWFAGEGFYKEAARVLKPGGLIALFTYTRAIAHPSVPGYKQVRQLLLESQDQYFAKYQQKGNIILKDLYRSLAKPAEYSSTSTSFDVPEYRFWNHNSEPDENGQYFCTMNNTASGLIAHYKTLGPIVKWMEAEKNADKSPEQILEKLKLDILHATGYGEQDVIEFGTQFVLLTIRKKGL